MPNLSSVNVRNVDADTWRELRLESVRLNRPLGDCLSEAVAAWLRSRHAQAAPVARPTADDQTPAPPARRKKKGAA